MQYDEFSDKLRKVKETFKAGSGKELKTIRELEEYLDRLLTKPKKKGARSLRGLSL